MDDDDVALNERLRRVQYQLTDMTMIGPQRRFAILQALRRGTVPREGLDAFAVRGEYGPSKSFFARWLHERARAAGFATSEVQVSETETPLHRWEGVYRRPVERLATADAGDGARDDFRMGLRIASC